MEEQTTAISKEITVPAALDAVKKRLGALEALNNLAPRTDGKFRWNPNYIHNDPINIFRLKDMGQIINIHQYIRTKHEAYNKSAELLQLAEYPVFEWMGYTFDAWDHDLRQRIAIITHHDKKSKLEEAKQALQGMMSKQDRVAALMSELGIGGE